MIVTFAAVVTLSKTRPTVSAANPIVASSNRVDALPSAQVPVKIDPPPLPELVISVPDAALIEGTNPPSILEKTPAEKAAAKEKAKLKREKAQLAGTDNTNNVDDSGRLGAASPASLTLAISPWGEIFVDGNRHGVSPPLRQLSLAPGKHTILIVNETFKPYSKTIELAPGGSLKIKYKFQN